MTKFPKCLLLFFLLGPGLLVACSPNPPLQKVAVVHQKPPVVVLEELPADRALAQAESLCAIGTRANEEEEWSLANSLFNEALDILANMDLEAEESEELKGRFDLLLLTLSVEYPKALQNMEELPGGSSLAMLLLRLGALLADTSHVVPETTIVQAAEADTVTYDVPIHWNTQVKQSIHFFQTQSRHVFSQWLSRSGRYVPMMRRILREHDLPEDLVYLAMIESGFNPLAYSWAHAAGPWQFISSTGRLYNLKADWWVDERRDPEKSTRAAARYLKNLYEEFASWPLALAAYNCGEQRVRSAIKKAGTNDFWELNLPRQTRNYVPLFMAALAIAKSPELYDFSVEYEQPIEYEEVRIDECTDLKVVAQCCGASYDEIKVLNPELRRWCTPPNYPAYRLKIPKGTQTTFLKNYALVPASEKITWQRHKIQRGETLSGIARHYGTSVSAIKEANSLRSSNRIIAGDHLLIPLSPVSGLAQGRAISSSPAQDGAEAADRKVLYTVRRGDNLYRIARDFGVTVAQLCGWNNLRSGQYIYPGNKLTVYPHAGFGASPGSSESYTELIYTVKQGDTLWDIANDFGVSLSSLIRENNLKDPSRLQPGKKLKVKMSTNL